jgi:predicted short-subunit dehydrogenase-like oxidoreductase (DUF2520 family)
MKVLLIGTGRLAFHLAHAIAATDLLFLGVAGRDLQKAKGLAEKIGSKWYGLDHLPQADLVILAVKDDAIEEVASRLPQSNSVVAHTSGASEMDRLLSHEHRGVIWPIQSFSSGGPISLKNVPLIIEGSDDLSINMIKEFSQHLSDHVHEADLSKRRKFHLAAVFASNFPVAMMMEAEELLNKIGMPSTLLTELWKTTAMNVIQNGASSSLTGPASRSDSTTIERHLEMLKEDPELQSIYKAISERIMRK